MRHLKPSQKYKSKPCNKLLGPYTRILYCTCLLHKPRCAARFVSLSTQFVHTDLAFVRACQGSMSGVCVFVRSFNVCLCQCAFGSLLSVGVNVSGRRGFMKFSSWVHVLGKFPASDVFSQKGHAIFLLLVSLLLSPQTNAGNETCH